MNDDLRAVVGVLSVVVEVVGAGYVFCSCLWNHRAPSVVEVMALVIGALVINTLRLELRLNHNA